MSEVEVRSKAFHGETLIADYLLQKHQESLEKLSMKKENEIWVHELCECSLKREWRRKLPWLETSSPAIVIGDFLHRGFLSWLKESGFYEIEVELEKEFNGYIIKGRADAISDEEVLELKYMGGFRERRPLEHHVLQLRIYLWMADKYRGRLVYMTPDGFAEYPIDSPISEMELVELFESQKAPRWEEWECSYCPYKNWCGEAVFHRETGGRRR